MEYIKASGASFFDEIAEHVGMLPVEAEEALAELVALGVVNSDSFGGLRALLVPSSQRGRASGRNSRRKRHMALFAMADAGRWALVRRPGAGERAAVEGVAGEGGAGEGARGQGALGEGARGEGARGRGARGEGARGDGARGEGPDEESIEHLVRTLLRRWGVVFWRLLAREAAWLPPWRDIVMCCRRLEARGEIRGGRFVAGFSGEQYATPEAIAPLREARRRPHTGQLVSLSGADPLNLLGIITPGARLPSLAGNRILYRDGLPIATYAAGEVQLLEKLEPQEEWEARKAVLRRHVPAALMALDDPA
jgi:ATP-dependent Lhr-like helicase